MLPHTTLTQREDLIAEPAAPQTGTGHDSLITRIAADLMERIRQLAIDINSLEGEHDHRTKRLAPNLREVHDVAGVSAAKLVGEVAAVARFRSRHAFARHNGTARANPSNPSSRTGRSTRKETIRSLKRRRSGVVDRAMLADAQIAIETPLSIAA
jgi:hypothetical protein